jgi:adenosylcobinamide kinase / adenosylcobinamide-phosphate guanylyltransferase
MHEENAHFGHELILGGQKSGKSRRAEQLAAAWLSADVFKPEALLIATAVAGDAEMQARIARHRLEREDRVPGLRCLELSDSSPAALADSIHTQTAEQRLVVVDCLTLWLTQKLMPLDPHVPALDESSLYAQEVQPLLEALKNARGPVVLVSNEIALGLVPLSAEVRRFVDVLGRLHQDVAAQCHRVCLMVAGMPLWVKGQA